MKHRFFSVALALVLAGCAAPASESSGSTILPAQVQLAAAAAPDAIRGVFDVKIRSIGEKHGVVYLNSELDYRDQRNLAIALTPDMAKHLADEAGAKGYDGLDGRHLLVTGAAKRVAVYFYADNRKTDKYYFQTHVNVKNDRQVFIVN